PRLERRQAGQPAHPGRPRAQRRRRELGPAQRLDRSAPANPRDARVASQGGGARLADLGHCPDQRRGRFRRRPARAARASAVRDLRHRGYPGGDRAKSHVRCRRPCRRSPSRRAFRPTVRASARGQAGIVRNSRQGSPVARGGRGFDRRDRRGHGLRRGGGRGQKTCLCTGLRPCYRGPRRPHRRRGRAVFRRHPVHRRRNDRKWPRRQNRQAHGPHARLWPSRRAGGASASRQCAAHFAPHQQLEPDSDPRIAGGSEGESGRLRDRLRRNGGCSMNIHTPSAPMSPEALEAALRAIGPKRYHDLHPFHGLLHDGKLNKGQVQAWALNRYVYQAAIPRKDASLIARCEDRELRREWLHRVMDHDGFDDDKGGIERWLVLTDGLGLDRDYVISQEGALPATKFAVEAYVRFVREKSLIEAVASSLTELFAPSIHKRRIAGMLANYDFIDETVIAYFRRRLAQAPKDAQFALDYVKANARTVEEQRGALAALTFKTDALWAQLDALHHAYVDGAIPPGAFRPE